MTINYCPICGSRTQLKQIEDQQRHVCSDTACDFIHWNNPVPVVAALVNYAGKYIIARNSRWPKKIFSVITGYLEEKESPQDAVIREVKEELGLHGQIRRHIGNYIFHEKNQLILCYEIEANGTIQTNHELAAVKQLSVDELLEYDFSPLYITQQIMQDWKSLR